MICLSANALMTLPHSLSTARRLAGRALNVKFTFWTGKPFFSSSLVPFDFAQKPVHHLSPSSRRFYFAFFVFANSQRILPPVSITTFLSSSIGVYALSWSKLKISFRHSSVNLCLSTRIYDSMVVHRQKWVASKMSFFGDEWRLGREREECWYESWILKQCSFHRSLNDDLQLLYRLDAVK